MSKYIPSSLEQSQQNRYSSPPGGISCPKASSLVCGNTRSIGDIASGIFVWHRLQMQVASPLSGLSVKTLSVARMSKSIWLMLLVLCVNIALRIKSRRKAYRHRQGYRLQVGYGSGIDLDRPMSRKRRQCFLVRIALRYPFETHMSYTCVRSLRVSRPQWP